MAAGKSRSPNMLNMIKTWFTTLSPWGKVAVIGSPLVTGAVLLLAFSSPMPEPPTPETPASTPQSVLPATETKPVTEVKILTETNSISFKTERTTDSNLEKGKTSVIQTGKNGKKEIKYEVTYEDGTEVSRKKVSETTIVKPINKIIAEGTYEAPKTPPPTSSSCDPNYSGCVPIASDVDCAGGSGNGPAYVAGPVRVIGYDIYGLDRDGDGYGCE